MLKYHHNNYYRTYCDFVQKQDVVGQWRMLNQDSSTPLTFLIPTHQASHVNGTLTLLRIIRRSSSYPDSHYHWPRHARITWWYERALVLIRFIHIKRAKAILIPLLLWRDQRNFMLSFIQVVYKVLGVLRCALLLTKVRGCVKGRK